jgi:hypothetical protein
MKKNQYPSLLSISTYIILKIVKKKYHSYVKQWIKSTTVFVVNIEQRQTAMLEDVTVHTARQETIPPSALTICVTHKPTDDKINKKLGREKQSHRRPH